MSAVEKAFEDDAREIAGLQAEVERLRERCDAYKGQVEAGSSQIEQLKDSLRWAMDEIDVLSNKLCGFAYPQGMIMKGVDRVSEQSNYVFAVKARRL